MGADFPCLRLDEPPLGPPPMAMPPPPRLNALQPGEAWPGEANDWSRANDWRRAPIPNMPFSPWRAHPWKAPPPHFAAYRRPPLVYDVPVKAPPPHLAALREPPLRRGELPIEAPPPHVFVVMEEPLPEFDHNERRTDRF